MTAVPPFNLARQLDPTASPKTVYRHLLRASAAHPDQYVARYFKAYWRVRAERLLASGLDEIRLQSRLDRIRKILRKMKRAANCIPEDYEWSLKQAYGLAGKSRHHLSDPFISSKILPTAKPIEPENPFTIPPTYSPMLVAMLDSSVIRDKPVSAPLLTVPPTLPPQGRPQSSELYIRPFMQPDREAKARWDHWNELLTKSEGAWPRTRYPLVVRLANVEAAGGEDPTPKLRALGIDWTVFAGGEREQVLDWLEAKAGKGLPMDFRPPVRPPITRESIARLASSTSPMPESTSASADDDLGILGHPAQPDRAFPTNHHLYYRRILRELPIVTIDMTKLFEPHSWFKASLSHWSKKGPGHYRPTSADDEGYTDNRRGYARK